MTPSHKLYSIVWITALSFIFISRIDAAAVSFEYEDDSSSMICIPNATFHIDCNRCKCSPSGMSMDCTDWICATIQIHHDILMNLSINCEHNEVFIYDDLKCLCLNPSATTTASNRKRALCSSARDELAHEMQPASGDVRRRRRVISLGNLDEPECPAGLVFKNQHGDTCICRENQHQSASSCLGVTRATAEVELHSPNSFSSGDEKQKKVCVPSSSFSLDCNQCVCSDNGLSFSCDSFPCLRVEMRDDQLLNLTLVCAPLSLFLYNRHECLCSSNGLYAMCSLAAVDVANVSHYHMGEVVVTESRRFCTPGAVFKDACNVCICGRDGKAACTMMDCTMGWENDGDDEGRIVRKEELWVQRLRNKKFCRKNEGSMYCRYLRKY